MEQDIADLLSDAFSDTFLSSYPEEDLSFDSLSFDEGDEKRNKTIGYNKLSVLTEVDESEEVLSSICEEDLFPKGESGAERTISQSLDVDAKEETSDEGDSRKERDEDDIQEGITEEVDSKEDKHEDTVTESRNKEDSSEEKDKDDVLEMQKIGDEEMGSVEYRVGTVVQKDIRDEMVDVVGEESSSDELDSREVKYEGVVMDKSTEYPSEVNRQQKEYFQDQEEDDGGMDHSAECTTDVIRKQKEYSEEQEEDMEKTQSGKGSYVTDEEEESDASRRKHDELNYGLCSLQVDRQEDAVKTHANESKEEEIYEGEQETLSATGIGSTGFSKGWSPVENEDAHNSLFEVLLEPQFEDDMKEFSEDDLGVIGEDYAEYPECFQQKDKGERTKKMEDMQTESMRKTPKLEMEGTAQLGGEIFEWELLDRHTEFHGEFSGSEGTARDIPDEKQSTVLKNLRDGSQNMFLERKHTEQQDSEGDCLRKEEEGMEGNRPVKDEMGEGIQEVMGYSFAWKKIDKRDFRDSEPQKDTMVFDVTHGDFLDVRDESGNEFQEKKKLEAKYCSQESYDKQHVSWTCGNEREKETGRSPEGNNGPFPKTRLMEGLCDFSVKANMASSDMGSGVGDLESRLSVVDIEVVDFSRMTEDCENTGEMSTGMVTPNELTLKVNWAEDPLITETRNSQEIFEKVCLVETENQFSESEEKKLTDVSLQYETYNVTDAQQHKFQNYNEEEEWNYEQDKERTEEFYQNDNDDQDCDTRQRSRNSKKHTVTFCLEPNLQRDSGSDLEDGDSTSSDSMEDQHTSETRQFLDLEEDSDDYRRRQTCALLQQSSATQRELLNLNRELKIHRQNDTISRMVKSFLKICLTTVVGILFFWWVADQLDRVGKDSVD
ncbi:uncharacterized protein LOC125745017 isoform X2 [Brienomyrus brachyistius]|uniref:uncharacterized protein LOC125745017 isoform X2 n=1 Tax=Brienomyrus brachyistius TaxID=42636 RepID=UPI0020B2772B|nr:uncharacterized protein LOC125745017 isoform X2 [Brienomyrus brachyistius]